MTPGTCSDRVRSLLARMTLEEKAGQLSLFADACRPYARQVNPEANHQDERELLQWIREGQVGGLFNGVGARKGAELQRVALEESRLAIPLLFGSDIIHGMRTVFPIPLGEAASFEPVLAERTARATAVEATAEGIHWTFAPMVDIARDQRWGRVAEGFGEDVLLGTEFARARVRGFHGTNSLTADDCLLACPKHFAAYGAAAAGLDYCGADVSEATLREVHFPPFKACVDEGALTIMTAFNDVAGVPASGNHWLQTQVLRGEWAFDGLVVSDYTADWELVEHGFAKDGRDAAKKALTAGVDLSMQSGLYYEHVPALVQSGDLPEHVLDTAVARVLHVKEAIGLFENPYRSLGVSPLQEMTRAALRGALPKHLVDGWQRKSGQNIALIGPCASDVDNIAGCWTLFGDAARYVSLEAGMRSALEDSPSTLSVTRGCDFEESIQGGLDAALASAELADVVVLALGEPQRFSGEAQSRTQIVLPAVQQALAESVAARGKPCVVLLQTGRALALQGAVRAASAIMVTWFLGSQSGNAIADVLFGDYNPSGRLPVSFPSDSGQQPFFYNRTRTGRPAQAGHERSFRTHWREVPHEALFCFGHGLSYTSFSFGHVQLSSTSLPWDGMLIATAAITNIGECSGEVVAQLYVHDCVASRVRPLRELKAFQKLRLEAGFTDNATFVIKRDDLSFCGTDGHFRTEAGEFLLWISNSCTEGHSASFELLPPDNV